MASSSGFLPKTQARRRPARARVAGLPAPHAARRPGDPTERRSASSGLEETSLLAIPCLPLRPNTERPVTVSLGTNTVSHDVGEVVRLVDDILAGRYKTGQPIPG
jgi:hypothetical protein